MSLAIFDLDNTLLGGDSDYLWGRFLVEQGLVDGEYYERENQRVYDQYQAGTLDIHEFLAFMLQPLTENPLAELLEWRTRFVVEKIQPILLPKATELLDWHRAAGNTLLIITATNRFITGPIAAELGVEHLIATEAEIGADGRYTGKPTGTPCFQAGKITRLNAWLAERGQSMASFADSWFYSDSRNDIPLLEQVNHPVAVDPDDALRAHAQDKGWPVVSLRGAF